MVRMMQHVFKQLSFCHQLVSALLCNDCLHGLHSELEVSQLADVTQPVGLELDANISG